MPYQKTLVPFHEETISFLNTAAGILMHTREAKQYPDIITLAFWMRASFIERMKKRFLKEDGDIYLGRGVDFHIAPSNVPVNYAYSLVVGMLTGNANIVRIPSRQFPQVAIINSALNQALEKHELMRPYVCLVRYGHDRAINDMLSAVSDTRIVWGGDSTIEELRKSPMKPRATEVTFADRYSLAVIDSDSYMDLADKKKAAEDFYNDTYLTDQNACTSPRLIAWYGKRVEEAKQVFWYNLHEAVRQKYRLQSIQGINKLTTAYLTAVEIPGSKQLPRIDNLLFRIQLPSLTADTMHRKDNSGYFMEYDCQDMSELVPLCDDLRCQTIGYIGNPEMLMPLLRSGIHGVDRVVPIGKTMDFSFIWDGYDLFAHLTRVIHIG